MSSVIKWDTICAETFFQPIVEIAKADFLSLSCIHQFRDMIDRVLVLEANKVEEFDDRMDCSEAVSLVKRSSCPAVLSSFFIRQKLIRGMLDHYNGDDIWALKQFKWGANFFAALDFSSLHTAEYYLSRSVNSLLCSLCGMMSVILDRDDHLEELTNLMHRNQRMENKTMFYIVYSRILERRAVLEGSPSHKTNVPHRELLMQSIQEMIKAACLAGDSDPFLVNLYDRLAVNYFLCGRAHSATLSFFVFLHDYFRTCIDVRPLRSFNSALFAEPSVRCTDPLIRDSIKIRSPPSRKNLWTVEYLIDGACLKDGCLEELSHDNETNKQDEKASVEFGYSCIKLWVNCYTRKHSKLPSPIQDFLHRLN